MGLHGGADASFLTADHLFLMAKECQNEKAPMCGCTNHAENLLPAPSRHLFSPSISVSDSLWRLSSKPFQAPYFPTVNCFTSPEPNYGLHTFSLSCLLSSFHTVSTSLWSFDKQMDLKIFLKQGCICKLKKIDFKTRNNSIEYYISESSWKVPKVSRWKKATNLSAFFFFVSHKVG